VASLLVHHACEGVIHEKARAGEAIVARVAPELDGVHVPDALAPVVGGCDQPERRAVGDAEAFAVEVIRQQHVGRQRVFQGEALREAVLRAQDDEGRARLRAHTGHDELLVEVAKPPSAPAQTALRPGRHTVEVRDLLHTLERSELLREAEGEVRESEAREVVDLDLGTSGARASQLGTPVPNTLIARLKGARRSGS